MNGDAKSRRPDHELARLAAGGDAAAFEEIHNRYRRLVYGIALRMTGNTADAEDLTQESFLSLLRRIGSFRGEAAFTSWLHRLTINQVLMHFRRRRSRPEDQTPDGAVPERRRARGARDGSSSPVVDRLAVERAVGALPPGYRAAFILHDVEGYEHGEIARLLGCNADTSKSQLHRARAMLRGMLANATPVLQT
jgi:RNA polymerase sigma-70 factor, ECF subfamily